MRDFLKQMNKKKLITVLAFALCAALLVTSMTLTLAKYASVEPVDVPAVAKSAYFESNLLSTTGATYDVGVDYISFELHNYADDLRFSDVDITYEVTITSTDPSASLGTGVNTEGTIPAGAKNSVLVTFTGLMFGKTYTVTASATSPYTKDLTATFTITETKNFLTFNVEDKGYIVELSVATNELDNRVNIYWQDGYVPDNSSAWLSGASGNYVYGLPLGNYSYYTFRFLKTDVDAVFDSSKFYVEISEPLIPDDSTESTPEDTDDGSWN